MQRAPGGYRTSHPPRSSSGSPPRVGSGSRAQLKTLSTGMTPDATPNAQPRAMLEQWTSLKGYASIGDAPALKNFASDLIPTVTAHLNMAKGPKA
jgi:putative membrane protein